jgi:hypothetical protein
VLSNLAIKNLSTTHRLIIVLALLTTVFWGNIFRFYPRLLDRAYDDTSEGLVLGRLARSAADGLTSKNADLGLNYDQTRPGVGVSELYNDQKRYFANPQLIDSLHLAWGPIPTSLVCRELFFRSST